MTAPVTDRHELIRRLSGRGLEIGALDAPMPVGEDVVVRYEGKEVYRGKPVPDVATILETLDARLDRRLLFDRRVRIPEQE